MDSSLKTFVDFKPGKKMRTRRELNKLSNKFIKRNGQKTPLIDDSESSDDDFVPKKSAVQRSTRLCKMVVLCVLIILISSCIVSVGGLAWFYFDLKRQCEALEVQLKLASPGSSDCAAIVTKQSSLEAKVQMLHSDLNTLRATTSTLEQLAEQSLHHMKSINVSVHQLSSLPPLVQAASNQLRRLESDVAGLHNATDLLGQQVRHAIDANSIQFAAVNKTLEKFHADMLTFLQGKEEEMWTRMQNVSSEQQLLLNHTSAKLMEFYVQLQSMNFSIMQRVGVDLQGVYAQFTTVRQQIAQLEYSFNVQTDCLFFADVKNCTAAEEVFTKLDSDGDGSVAVGDVLKQSAAVTNCSTRFLQYLAGPDGAYTLPIFVRAVGLVDCPHLLSGRRRRSGTSQDIRWMMQSLNVEVP